MLGNWNATFSNVEIDCVIGKYGVPVVNENGCRLHQKEINALVT